MNFLCACLKKMESVEGDELTLGFPDAAGQIIVLKGEPEGNLDALIPGKPYTIAFVPLVEQDHSGASLDAINEAPDQTTPVPVDHPVVFHPDDAADAISARPEDVLGEVQLAPEPVVESTGEATA